MRRTSQILVLLTSLVVFFIAVPPANAGPHFFFQIGVPVPVAPVVVAPRYVPPPPVYGYGYPYVWRGGYYNWNGYGYGWVPGAYVRPPYAGAVWVGPRWVHGPRGAYWARGYWGRGGHWRR